jgi:hypothetical protein
LDPTAALRVRKDADWLYLPRYSPPEQPCLYASVMDTAPACRRCGTPLAHNHATDRFCSACQHTLSTYNPQHDPAFAGALLALLLANPGP